jgi:hypothetical protein
MSMSVMRAALEQQRQRTKRMLDSEVRLNRSDWPVRMGMKHSLCRRATDRRRRQANACKRRRVARRLDERPDTKRVTIAGRFWNLAVPGARMKACEAAVDKATGKLNLEQERCPAPIIQVSFNII